MTAEERKIFAKFMKVWKCMYDIDRIYEPFNLDDALSANSAAEIFADMGARGETHHVPSSLFRFYKDVLSPAAIEKINWVNITDDDIRTVAAVVERNKAGGKL